MIQLVKAAWLHIKKMNGAGISIIVIIFGFGSTYRGMTAKMDDLSEEFGGLKARMDITSARIENLEAATKMVDRLDARLLSTTTGRTWYQDSVNLARDQQVAVIQRELQASKRRQDTLKVAIDRVMKLLIWDQRKNQ